MIRCSRYYLTASLVHSRIDYANSLVHGSTNIKKLQRLQNTADRIVLPHLSKLPSTSLLRELHWLPVHSRIIYKLACLTYNSLTTGQPGYLRSLFNYYTPPALYDQLTNFFLIVHGSPLNLEKDPSATLHPQSGMICLLIQGSPPPLIPLSAVTRQSSSHSLPVLPT